MNDEFKKLDLSKTEAPPKVYPRLNRRLRIAMWLSLFVAPVVIAMAAYDAYRASQLKSVGKQTIGRLVSSETLNTGRGRTNYQIKVDYKPPDGQTVYRKTFVVSEEVVEQAKQNGECTVTYLPSDPTFSTVGDSGGANSELLAVGGGVLLFGLGIWWYQRRQLANVERYVTSTLGNEPKMVK